MAEIRGEKMTKFEYNRKEDILVFEHRKYDNYDRSIEVANFVVDLDKEGGFLGLEIINASKRLPMTKEELESIEKVETRIFEDEEDKMATIWIYREDEKTSLNVPVLSSASEQAA